MMTQVVLAINETVLVQFAKDFFLVKAHVDKIMLPSTYPRYGAVAFAKGDGKTS